VTVWATAEVVRGVAAATAAAVVMVTMAEGETAVATLAVARARMMAAAVMAEVAMVVAAAAVTGGTRYHRSIWHSHMIALLVTAMEVHLQTASAAPVSIYIGT
jgi:hypothetical protein